MSKLTKAIITGVSYVLVAAMAIGGTIAYLQDTDSDVNVMTLGNVQIEQIEQERNAAGELVDFTQAKPLYPYVGEVAWNDAKININDHDYNMFGEKLKNAQDKIVTVKNTGKSDAYVRTWIALEDPFTVGLLGVNVGGVGYTQTPWFGAEIDGVQYSVTCFTYNEALKPGEESLPSFLQVYLKSIATNEDVALLGDTYDILVLSQAVQTAGFADAETALNTAFGEDHPWADGVNIPTVIEAADSAALAEAVANNNEAIIRLNKGKYTTNLKVNGGKNVTIIGAGKDTVLSGQIATTSSTAGTITLQNLTVMVDDSIVDSTGISQTSKSAIAIWGNQTVICENVTFDMSLANSTAITSWWDTGVGTTVIARNCTFNCNGQRPIRATGNVTVENCTFNDPYRYAVQLTAKTSTATELDKAIINFNNNTIVNGANGKAFVYGIQLEGADYGCNDCVINGTGNTIVDGGTESAMYYCECGKVVHETIEWNTEVTPVHEK